MAKYYKGSLYKTAYPRCPDRPYVAILKPKVWINPPVNWSAVYLWTNNGIIYYSKGSSHYRLNGDEWVEHSWDNGQISFDGWNVWSYNGVCYLSTYANGVYSHFKLVGNRWEPFSHEVTDFIGQEVWSPSPDGQCFMTRNGQTYFFSESRGFTADNRFVPYNFDELADNNNFWSDGNTLYANTYEYVSNRNFIQHDFGNIPLTNGILGRIETDGTNVYYDSLYEGPYVIVDGKFIRYNAIYDSLKIPTIGKVDIFWSDGRAIYIWVSVLGNNFSYQLEFADNIPTEYALPNTENTVTINLFQNNSEKNVIGKSLTSVRNLNGTFKQEADIVNLSIQVDLSSVPNFNYIRVPSFNRYYFVDNIVNIRDDLWEISCHVDVLESFKDTIMSTYGLIERNEFEFNPKIIDHLRVIEQGVTTEVLTGGMTLETVLNAGVPQTMTETSPRFMLVGTFMSLEGEIT